MVDYSKWDHIEISDDEDDVHPNVDTPSLFRWRHEARVKRVDEEQEEKAKKNAQEKLRLAEIEKLETSLKSLELVESPDEATKSKLEGLQKQVAEMKGQQEEFEVKEAELAAFEKAHPKWHVDNMSEDKHNRTLINKDAIKPKSDGTGQDMTAYFNEHGDEVKAFGMFSKHEDSHKYLKSHMYLVCDHLASYLVIWAVDLQVEEKTELMEMVARQAIVAQYILELAKTLKRDPRSCVDAFFTRVETAEKQYIDAFEDEYNALLQRVRDRAVARMEEAREEAEKEEAAEREKRLGPAGLDPLEVIEQIPAKMKEAFQTQNTPMLKESFAELEGDEMDRVYNLVVGSGLWVPQGGGAGEDEGARQTEEDEEID